MGDVVYLAPLHGFTDYVFRNVYLKHFRGVDFVISPFISLTHGTKITPKKVRDLNPENNNGVKLIPQVLGNESDLFVQLANFLENWGYKSLNWNLGCPIKGIVNKKRGSGLLPYPKDIRNILDNVIPKISQKLSVKIRLGYDNTDEIYSLVSIFNDYPLEFVCIHPRLGIQMYEGNIHFDFFEKILFDFKAPLIYNGDICDIHFFKKIKTKYPSIKNWMLGRSVIYNPIIPAQIKENFTHQTNTYFEDFIYDLYENLLINKAEIMFVNKVKDYWIFISKRYFESKRAKGIIVHSQTIRQIYDNTKFIFKEFDSKY